MVKKIYERGSSGDIFHKNKYFLKNTDIPEKKLNSPIDTQKNTLRGQDMTPWLEMLAKMSRCIYYSDTDAFTLER